MKKKDEAKALARKNKKAADKATKVEEAVSAEEEAVSAEEEAAAPKEEAAAPKEEASNISGINVTKSIKNIFLEALIPINNYLLLLQFYFFNCHFCVRN